MSSVGVLNSHPPNPPLQTSLSSSNRASRVRSTSLSEVDPDPWTEIEAD
jgi:hypothetical protein